MEKTTRKGIIIVSTSSHSTRIKKEKNHRLIFLIGTFIWISLSLLQQQQETTCAAFGGNNDVNKVVSSSSSSSLFFIIPAVAALTVSPPPSSSSSSGTMATRSVLVTGANRGIGLETVRQLLTVKSNGNSNNMSPKSRLVIATACNPETATECARQGLTLGT